MSIAIKKLIRIDHLLCVAVIFLLSPVCTYCVLSVNKGFQLKTRNHHNTSLQSGVLPVFNIFHSLNFLVLDQGVTDVAVVSCVQVIGELSNNGQPMRKFVQSFVLAAQSAKKYYVHIDIFRYQDIYQQNATESEQSQSHSQYLEGSRYCF